MKLYPVPGGGWEGTEADWKKAMKAKGLDPKQFDATKTREVPTGKKELMEFLTFFSVDVYRTGTAAPTPTPTVDVEALRAEHNPVPCGHGDAPDRDPAPQSTPTDSTADVQLSRMENPGVDIDSIVEFVSSSTGYALKRVAGAVAAAFGRLAAAD